MGKCLGGAFTKTFESFQAVKTLPSQLQSERTDAKDREQRLNSRLDTMEGQLTKQREMIADLEVRLLKEMKMKESRMTEVIEDSITKTGAVPSSSNGTEALEAKSPKRKRVCDQKNKNAAKPSANWADDGCSSEEEAAKKKEEKAEAPQHVPVRPNVRTRTEEEAAKKKEENAEAPQHVPVRPNVRPVRTRTPGKAKQIEPMLSEDESWTLVTAKKPGPKKSVLYVGNLNVGCSVNNLLEFVQIRAQKIGEKAPQIFNVKMFEPKNELRFARLTVAKSDAVLLRSSNFWPRPIYARSWNFDRNVSSSNELKAMAAVDCLSLTAENQVAHSTNSVPKEPELAAQ